MSGLLGPDNRMFALANRGRRLTNPVVAIIVAFVAPIILGVAGILLLDGLGALVPGEASLGGSALGGAAELVLELVFSFGPIFLFLWAWVVLFEGRSFRTLGLGLGGAGRGYLRGLLVGFLMFGAVAGVAALVGYAAWDRSTDPALRGVSALGAVLLTYVGWTVQGPAEEILVRGWLLQVIGVRWGVLAGVLVSSVVFTALHSLNPNLSPLSVLNLFLFGVFFALWVLWEGALWGAFAWHAVWNWAQGNVFGYEVSGANAPGGALIDLRESGPDLVTGGAFGPEGGLMVTAMLVAGVVVIFVLAARRGPTTGERRFSKDQGG